MEKKLTAKVQMIGHAALLYCVETGEDLVTILMGKTTSKWYLGNKRKGGFESLKRAADTWCVCNGYTLDSSNLMEKK